MASRRNTQNRRTPREGRMMRALYLLAMAFPFILLAFLIGRGAL